MKFMRVKTCCELLNVNCDQGRKCPNRTNPFNIHPTHTDKSDAMLVILMWVVLTAVLASLAMAAVYFLYPF